jgi:hypothetical protein
MTSDISKSNVSIITSPNTVATPSLKIFKDSSELYKSYVTNVIDRVYIHMPDNSESGISNMDGYEIRKKLVRSDRFPIIGDMFCSQHSDNMNDNKS